MTASAPIRNLHALHGDQPPDPPGPEQTAVLAADSLRLHARSFDRAGQIPPSVIELLHAGGLLSLPFTDHNDWKRLIDTLLTIGTGDLSVGRLLEGHFNAVQLVQRFGARPQVERVERDVSDRGMLLGVWNTDAAAPLTAEPLNQGWSLSGGKSFASGSGLVGPVLTTCRMPDGSRQMLLLPKEALSRADPARWTPLGMRASMSFTVDFSGVKISRDDMIGGADDYLAEPWFSAGCVRFAAVQLGGAFALVREVHRHLRAANRAQDPYQIERFAHMKIGLATGRLWVHEAARRLQHAAPDEAQPIIDAANAARTSVELTCRRILDFAAQSIGVQGFLAPHPAERLIRDLMTYLRQPAPDEALASIGRHALAAAEFGWD